MSCSRFILSALLLSCSIGVAAAEQRGAETPSPNIVLIVADDLGYGDLATYGNPVVETPHLDRLAAEGVRFTQAYASCTVCSPTRAALLTGMNPVDVNITDYIRGKQAERGPLPHEQFLVPEINQHLPHETVTIAELLKTRGYRTASIGKWHLGGNGSLPTDHGFDVNVGGNHHGLPPSYHHPYISDRFQFQLENLPPRNDGRYLTDRLTDEAVAWIGDQKVGAPFFLYLPFYTVHTPIEGRPDLVDYYRAKNTTTPDGLKLNPEFLAMVHALDLSVGRIRAALEKNGRRENTLIIFVSDNGGLYTRTGDQIPISYNGVLREGKATHYEGGLRVPTIVHWPKHINGGRVEATPVISTDVFPTILEVIRAPREPFAQLEGVSLWPLLSRAEPLPERPFVWHYPHYHRTTPGSVIREGDYKLIKFYEGGRLELYNLAADPGEQTDLAGVNPEKAAELHAKLLQWLENRSARFPTVNPGWLGETFRASPHHPSALKP